MHQSAYEGDKLSGNRLIQTVAGPKCCKFSRRERATLTHPCEGITRRRSHQEEKKRERDGKRDGCLACPP